jgi:glycosyltransferase involved in cell wall biosynthesis
MVTTFFGPHAIGGDASYVDRLSRALLRRGHDVEVVHCADAFAAAARGHAPQPYEPPDGLRVHTLRSRIGRLSPLWTHQTGGPGPKAAAIDRILDRGHFDVVHFHNLSLIGGPGIVERTARRRAVRLMTAHEHWLVCPLSLLWKLDRAPCDEPQCVRCALHARRPPQLWRAGGRMERGIGELDALVCPSASAARIHRTRGVRAPIVELGHLLPSDWAGGELPGPRHSGRPYVAAAGRLVREKGFEPLIETMRRLPEVDLRIAGAGPLGGDLQRLAAGMPNVEFVGHLPPRRLASLFAGAAALVVPSVFYETFGYVILEAASVATPAIVRRRGALPEVVDRLGAGIVFDTDAELESSIRRLVTDPALSRAMGERALAGLRRAAGEADHVERYLELVETCARRRGYRAGPARGPTRPAPAGRARAASAGGRPRSTPRAPSARSRG